MESRKTINNHLYYMKKKYPKNKARKSQNNETPDPS